jgi:KaiC/GvpD/RAD55 family RecA-like ATPase
MEIQLLAIMLRSRDSYTKVYSLINLRQYSKEFQQLAKLIVAYYGRDAEAQSVDPNVLLELIQSTYTNDKHIAIFKQLMDEAVGAEVSQLNVEATVIAAKQHELEQQIALSCVNKDGKALELMEEYRKLSSMSTLEELLTGGATIVERITVDSLVAERREEGMLMKVLPRVINDRLDGGLLPGHHVTVFARPEMGKSLGIISFAGGFARQGYPVLFIENEDRPSDVQMRLVSNLSGMDRRQVLNDPEKAQRVADTNGLEQVKVVELTPGTPHQIEELVARYSPSVVIINQLRNLNVGEQNKVIALEEAAKEARNIGKRNNAAVISVTQAGDSADGKRFLEMGDVDFSNTGIPAQCDVLMGIGGDEAMIQQGERGISFPKNKIGVGRDSHDPVVVKVRPDISRMLSPSMNNNGTAD